MEGPVADKDGNRVQIRYQRKIKEQYLMTEVDGKATGWRADYANGQWQITEKTVKPKAKAKAKSKAKAKPKSKAKAKEKK